jgi:hypothetical protein
VTKVIAQAVPSTFVPDMGLGYHVAYSILVVAHLLMALVLLGALTHQALALVWPVRSLAAAPGGAAPAPSLLRSYRAVRVNLYTNAVIILYLITGLMGAFLYGPYRLTILPFFYGHGLKLFGGLFEFKEHLVVLGLGLLPIYWLLWKKVPLAEQVPLRTAVTAILAVFVWYAFLIGHILNNLKGLGT